MPQRPPAAAGTRRRLGERALATLLCSGLLASPAAAGSADSDRDGLGDRTELGATAVRHPALTPLTTALARRSSRPVRLLFLGSSTTYGVGASSPASRYVDQVVGRLGRRFPSGGDDSAPVRDLQRSTDRPDDTPGVQGVNGGVGGVTAATYVTAAHEYGVGVLQPACVIHMIGSNDAVAQVPLTSFRAAVEDAVRRIDAASERPPCHVLLQPVRRFQVSPEAWAAYGQVLAQVAGASSRVTYVDVGAEFEARGAPGPDPDQLIGPDEVHLTDAGHALLATTLLRAIDLTRRGLGTGTDPRRADTDRDGIRDRSELGRRVVRVSVVPCEGATVHRLWTRTLGYEPDTDEDGLGDRTELRGYPLADGRFVRSDPADADTDGDGADDGREWLSGHGDPVTCQGRRPAR